MSPHSTVFYGALINPKTLTELSVHPCALLAVSAHGVIDWIIEDIEFAKVKRVLEEKGLHHVKLNVMRKGEWLMPGFIDTHTHAAQGPSMGSGQQYELLDWLKNVIFPTEAKFECVKYAKMVYPDVVRRFVDSGTTTCCYYGSLHLEATKVLADTVHKLGQRAFVGKCNMNHGSPDFYREKSVEESLTTTHELFKHIDHLNSPLVKPILTPRFALSCTPDLLCKLGHIAKHNAHLAIQTHISENKKEVHDVLEMYKDWGVKTYAEVYDKAGLLTDRTILGHAVHLERSEMELIKQRGAGVSHCPTSNFNLNSGMARVGEMLDLGIKVGLGTDVSGGFSPSMLRTIQDACFTSKMIAVYPPVSSYNEHGRCQEENHRTNQFTNKPLRIPALVYLATVGGAQLCHLEHTVGTLEPGKSFDAILVSVRPESGNAGIWTGPEEFNGGLRNENVALGEEEDAVTQSTNLTEETKKLEAWLERFIFGGDERNVEKVFVQGRLIGGRVSNLSDNETAIATDM